MKKLYFILMSSLAVLLLIFGIWTFFLMASPTADLQEDRVDFPKYSHSALADGSYTAQIENYYADNFPFREFFMSANRMMNKLYYFSPIDNLLSIDFQGGAEQGGANLNDEIDTQETEETPSPNVNPYIEEPREEDVTSVGTIIINGNRAMDIPTADNETILQYAGAVNDISFALGEKTRVFSLITPNSGEFYSPKSYHSGIHDQKAMISLCYGNMNDEIITVDAYTAIEQHKNEYLFFRTDHHWTQKGAYYAYTAFCDAAGFASADLDSFKTGTYEDFVGSMFNYTSGYPQSLALKDNPDFLTYYLPPVETTVSYYMDSRLENGVKIDLINTNLSPEIKNKYLCFISGDTPICVIESDAAGGTCIVLKESYGNAFIPFLAQHYSKIIAIDPREFSGAGEPVMDLPAFAASQNVNDVLIINYPFMMSNKAYISYLTALIS